MHRQIATAVSAVLGVLAVTALPAHAQNAADQNGGTDQNAAAGGQLSEVVVTAERRATDVQTTPIAVNALSGAQLQAQHITTVGDLQTVAPIAVTNGGWHQQINIRGIGNSVISASINIGVAVIRDGLFEAETLGQNEPLYDIADTEILRGPQGTFVGYASTGGAVEINSANPNFRGVNGYVQAAAGNYSDRALQGAINLPASQTLAMRIAFNMETRNSFYRDLGGVLTPASSAPVLDPGNLNNKQTRISLLWKPTENFQLLAKNAYDNEQSDGLASQVDPGSYTDPISGTVIHAPFYDQSTHQPFVLNADRTDQKFDTQKYETGVELRYTLPNQIVLRSMTGFEQIAVQLNQDSDATYLPYQWQFRDIPPDDYYSQEFNVISPTSGRVNWIAGATVFYRDTPVNSVTYNATPPNFLYPGSRGYTAALPQYSSSASHSVERIAGVFGQINWHFTDTLELQVGARENWDNNFNKGASSSHVPNSTNTAYLPPRISPSTGHYSDSVPTGKIDLNWTPVPGQFFYVFYARGYKSGGVNGDTTTFSPEHVNDYELGWKGQLLDRHLQTQIGGYWMQYQDYQYSILSPVTGRSDVIGLPTATIKGIEASFQANLAGLQMNAGIYYNKSTLGALTAVATYKLPSTLPGNTPGCAPGVPTPPNQSCFQYAPYEVNLSGEQNAFSPELTVSADIGYAIPMGTSTLTPKVTYSHIDKQYGSIFQNDTYWLMPARNLWGADLQYTSGPWLLDLYGTNLSNQVYVSGFYGAGGNNNDAFYGAPRQYGLRLNYAF